jgi:hypothetical protein
MAMSQHESKVGWRGQAVIYKRGEERWGVWGMTRDAARTYIRSPPPC